MSDEIPEPIDDLRERIESLDLSDLEYEDAEEEPPDLSPFYETLRWRVEQIARGYSDLLILDAKGGLGKTHNVLDVLQDEKRAEGYSHAKGFTTPVELYRTLWKARHGGHVLFLDDVSGITRNNKSVEMLKAATDTYSDENWVEYRSSRDIPHPIDPERSLPQKFQFRGALIMSFNDTPSNPHFNALKDRSHFLQMRFDRDERLALIQEVAKVPELSELTVEEQQECAAWIAEVTNAAMNVSIRTLVKVCQTRHFGQQEGRNWMSMSLETFNMNYRKYLIIQLRESGLPVEEQVEIFKEKTGLSQRTYYDDLSEIKSARM